MNSDMKLPSEYTPYNTLNLCSNIASYYRVPIGARNYFPLLIGKGRIPIIWLAMSNPDNTEEWRYLVRMNKSLHPGIIVSVNNSECSVSITSEDKTIISVASQDPDSVTVNSLDLRSIGLNIVGDTNGLNVGGQSLSGNIFSGVGTIVGLD